MNERTSVASFARAFKSTRLIIRFKYTSNEKVPYVFVAFERNQWRLRKDSGRPIVSACSRPTELISSYLDRIMVPIVKSLSSYINDTNQVLGIFRDFDFPAKTNLFLLWTLLLYIP